MRPWKAIIVLTTGLLLMSAPSSAAELSAQADCLNTSASVSITSGPTHTCPDTLEADGSWSVTSADGVELTFWVAGDEYQREDQTGSSGTWSFVDLFEAANGTYEFKVKACPRVWNGDGYTVCRKHCSSTSADFPVDCPCDDMSADIVDCTWNCDFGTGDCTGTCDGQITTTCPDPYYHRWGVEDGSGTVTWTDVQSTSSTSFSSPTLSCVTGDPIHLEMQDGDGNVLASDPNGWSCGLE